MASPLAKPDTDREVIDICSLSERDRLRLITHIYGDRDYDWYETSIGRTNDKRIVNEDDYYKISKFYKDISDTYDSDMASNLTETYIDTLIERCLSSITEVSPDFDEASQTFIYKLSR